MELENFRLEDQGQSQKTEALTIVQHVSITPQMMELIKQALTTTLKNNPELIREPFFQLLSSDKMLKEGLLSLIGERSSTVNEASTLPDRIQVAKLDDIHTAIVQIFSDIHYLKSVILRPISNGISVVFIHTNEDRVKALHEIQERLMRLEDMFVEINFEPSIIHQLDNSEVFSGRKINFMS